MSSNLDDADSIVYIFVISCSHVAQVLLLSCLKIFYTMKVEGGLLKLRSSPEVPITSSSPMGEVCSGT